MAVGMNDYVTKTVSPQALMEALEKWLQGEEKTADLSFPYLTRRA